MRPAGLAVRPVIPVPAPRRHSPFPAVAALSGQGRWPLAVLLFVLALISGALAVAPAPQLPVRLAPGARALLRQMADIPAPSGGEALLLRALAGGLHRIAPQGVARWDSLGNLSYRFPSAATGRLGLLVVTAVDQPGFVVSQVRPDGYLRVQPVSAGRGWPRGYQKLLFANAVTVLTSHGPVGAVGAGLSVHLLPTRSPGKVPGYGLDNLYLDTGASSRAQDRAAGIRLLDPVTLATRVRIAPSDPIWAGPALASRAAIPALASLVAVLSRGATVPPGGIGIAFATERYFGRHGLQRLIAEYQPRTVLLVAPNNGPSWSLAGNDPALRQRWLAASQPMPLRPAPPLLAQYLGSHCQFLLVRFPLAHLHTAAEMLDTRDVAHLLRWLGQFVSGSAGTATALADWPRQPAAMPAPRLPPPPGEPLVVTDLRRLIAVTGVSHHEAPVRRVIRRLIAGNLPAGATLTTGPAGDLILAWGPPHAARSLLFIAHMDEIGWQVQGRLPGGALALQPEGYGLRAFYTGQILLVHTARGAALPGELHFVPAAPGVAFGAAAGRRRWLPRLDLDLSLAQEDALGVGLGDAVAVPKVYRPLLNRRAAARSMDDRVGDAALVAALGRLRGFAPRDRIYFVWSTGEELGLLGAQALARRLHPSYVFALDTFVSSDSPLENPRFADALLGRGFVIRAVDNSIFTPPALVRRLRGIAVASHIPVQVGITGGGNDGSAFLPDGSQVMALGWPLRYSHSPAEVVDTRDVQALTRMVAALVRHW